MNLSHLPSLQLVVFSVNFPNRLRTTAQAWASDTLDSAVGICVGGDSNIVCILIARECFSSTEYLFHDSKHMLWLHYARLC